MQLRAARRGKSQVDDEVEQGSEDLLETARHVGDQLPGGVGEAPEPAKSGERLSKAR